MGLHDNQALVRIWSSVDVSAFLRAWFDDGTIEALSDASDMKESPDEILNILKQIQCFQIGHCVFQFVGGVAAMEHITQQLRGTEAHIGALPQTESAVFRLTFPGLHRSMGAAYMARIRQALIRSQGGHAAT